MYGQTVCIFSKNFWSFETSPSIPLGCYIDCSENDQSMGTVHWTVHSHCVVRFEAAIYIYARDGVANDCEQKNTIFP